MSNACRVCVCGGGRLLACAILRFQAWSEPEPRDDVLHGTAAACGQ